MPGFPRAPAAPAARPGEITIEVLRAYQPVRPDWKSLAKRVLGRETLAQERRRAAATAREFNDWLQAPGGWLAG